MAFFILLFLFSIVVIYFIVKLAVKHAINEILEDMRPVIRKEVVAGLLEYEYKKQNGH